MPRVPAAPQTVVTESVRSAPLRSPLQPAPTADFDALAGGVMSAGEAIERGNLQLSQIRLTEAENEVLERWNQRLFTDEDAYYKLNGKESVEALDPRMKELADIQSEISGRLTTATERRLFTNAMASRGQQHRAKMSLNSFDERQQWDRSTAVAGMGQQLESAANDPSPENLRITEARVLELADTIATIDGAPPEARDLAAFEAVSGMYRGVVEAELAADRPFQAQAIFDRYEDSLSAADQTALTEALSEATLATESTQLSAEALSKFDNAEDQLKFIAGKFGKNPSPKQLEVITRARSKTTTARNQIETAEGITRSENFNFLGERVIAATSQGSSGIRIIEALERAFPERFGDDAMTTSQRASLVQLAGDGAATETTADGWAAYSELMLLSKSNPAALAGIDPMAFRSIMGDTQFNATVKLIADVAGAGITSETSYLRTQQTTLNKRAESIGIDLTKDKLSKRGTLLQREVADRVDEFTFLEKRKPNQTEYDSILDFVFIDTLLPSIAAPIDLSSKTAVPQVLGRMLFGPDLERKGFEVQVSDIPTETIREELRVEFQRRFGRLPGKNELSDFYITILNNPADRRILLESGR